MSRCLPQLVAMSIWQKHAKGCPGRIFCGARVEAAPMADASGREEEILAKIARPDIYRTNAFRILHVAVTASLREASNQLRKLDMLEKLGKQDTGERSSFALSPAPDAEARREAYQRLCDAETRLIDEAFWFWPLDAEFRNSQDEALAALERNDINAAVTIWKQHESGSGEAGVSVHNLAVMYHTLALDMELTEPGATDTAGWAQQRDECWEQALPRWQALLGNGRFGTRITSRIQEINDPSLTADTARQLQALLPQALLSINATLAARAAQKGNNDRASYHMQLIQQWGFDLATSAEVVGRAAAPLRQRIKAICANAAADVKSDGAEHADGAVKSLVEQATPVLSMLDLLLPAGHPTRVSAHDEVAAEVIDCAIAFGKKTKDWSASARLLEQAIGISASQTVHDRVSTNLQTARENMELSVCWFCKKNKAEYKAAVDVAMYWIITRESTWLGTQLQWQHTTVYVPRCKRCESVHDRVGRYGCLGTLLGVVMAIVMGNAAQSGLLAIIMLALFSIGGFLLHAVTKPPGHKGERYKTEYPRVKAMIAQGWELGEKPPGT